MTDHYQDDGFREVPPTTLRQIAMRTALIAAVFAALIALKTGFDALVEPLAERVEQREALSPVPWEPHP